MALRIGIDARLWGINNTGIGRYIESLFSRVIELDKENEYVFFVSEPDVVPKRENVSTVIVRVPHYSLSEQIIMTDHFERAQLDVLHIPHFNAPLLYKGKMVVTIHDLIKHYSKGSDTTTRSPILYWPKYLAYRLLFSQVARKAQKIIVPTEYVAKDLAKNEKIKDSKIEVIYEAVADSFNNTKANQKNAFELINKLGVRKPYLVYTGALYPHKNIEVVLRALAAHNNDKELDFTLVIVCARNAFAERIKKKILEYKLADQVIFAGFLSDQELIDLYSEAFCLVHPSKMEGFGLTGLEAMSKGLPVISSNSTCLPEVYNDACLYFDPDNEAQLIENLMQLKTSSKLYDELVDRGKKQAARYKWSDAAKKTISLYEEVAKRS